MCHRLAIIAIALGLMAGPAAARIDVVATGFYCMPDPDRIATPGVGAQSGRVWVSEDVPLPARRGTIVPTAVGISFGVFFETTGRPGVLDVHLTHPPFADTDSTSQNWRLRDVVPGTRKGAAYTLDTEDELAPGTWTFDIRRGDRTVLRQDFMLVDGADAEDLLSSCQEDETE
ncbi:MAG: DUF3859 domain-containing protein [Pseudomonadota bacterium]